jgi:hypothetical protein
MLFVSQRAERREQSVIPIAIGTADWLLFTAYFLFVVCCSLFVVCCLLLQRAEPNAYYFILNVQFLLL